MGRQDWLDIPQSQFRRSQNDSSHISRHETPSQRENEVCAKIGKNGATPIPVTGVITDHMKEYISQVKAYERHAVKAAIYGDKDEAMRALVINPLVGDLKTASACFDEMLEAHKDYLPQFFKEEK